MLIFCKAAQSPSSPWTPLAGALVGSHMNAYLAVNMLLCHWEPLAKYDDVQFFVLLYHCSGFLFINCRSSYRAHCGNHLGRFSHCQWNPTKRSFCCFYLLFFFFLFLLNSLYLLTSLMLLNLPHISRSS